MNKKINIAVVRVKDIPTEYTERIRVNDHPVDIEYQITGFGRKRLMVCPLCDTRRTKLYLYENDIYCRSCLPFDIYKYRRNMYDEGGEKLITWHMYRLMHTIGFNDICFPFHYGEYIGRKPSHMRHNTFSDTLKKVQMLENMRNCAIFAGKRFTAADIRNYTSEDFSERYTTKFLADNLIFANLGEIVSRIK